MCSTCITVLSDWRRDPAVEAVLIDHSGERGFCAGGDIRMLADSGASDGRLAREFFFTEYRLNHLLFSYPKPVIAVMDGITMGGGVGLSAPARYRLATERTTFAMPETGIGLFPDVGGGWFLPRLPGRIGLWLALTGARIKAADCLHAGLATHYLPSERLPELKAALAENPSDIEALLAQFHVDPGPAPLLAHRAELDAAFGQGSVEAILAALEAGSDWAQAQALALRTKSPQTLKVAFRQLALGAIAPDFTANMAMEYRIGARVVQRHDVCAVRLDGHLERAIDCVERGEGRRDRVLHPAVGLGSPRIPQEIVEAEACRGTGRSEVSVAERFEVDPHVIQRGVGPR
jgi:enoyl-CoA hydratase